MAAHLHHDQQFLKCSYLNCSHHHFQYPKFLRRPIENDPFLDRKNDKRTQTVSENVKDQKFQRPNFITNKKCKLTACERWNKKILAHCVIIFTVASSQNLVNTVHAFRLRFGFTF